MEQQMVKDSYDAPILRPASPSVLWQNPTPIKPHGKILSSTKVSHVNLMVILGNPGYFFICLFPEKKTSLLKLVPEVEIQVFADWSTH